LTPGNVGINVVQSQYGLTLTEEEITRFLLAEVEPVFHFQTGEKSFRAAVRLSDGAYFPCVEFKSASQLVDRSIHKFDELKDETVRRKYRDQVYITLCLNNMISPRCICSVERSSYALPANHRELLRDAFDAFGLDIYGNYLSCVAVMDDGKKFYFSFTVDPETNFLDLPDGYTADQIIQVIPNRKLPQKQYSTRLPFACYLSTL